MAHNISKNPYLRATRASFGAYQEILSELNRSHIEEKGRGSYMIMMRTTRIYFIVMLAMVTMMMMMMIRTKRMRRVLTQRKAEWQWTRFIGYD